MHRTADAVFFASEIRSLLQARCVPRHLDRQSLAHYLAYQTVPTPRTLVANVDLLEPGHVAVLSADGRWRDQAYWDPLRSASVPPRTSDEARRRVSDLLLESTALHLVSDVPVGVFLSGGIDSSALVALMRHAGVAARTFAVVSPGTPQDEGPFARAIAQRYGAEHTEIAIPASELRDEMLASVTEVDHPSGDGFNTFVVSRAVRRAGIKVALSGLGGDELFGGYPSFRRLRRLQPYAGLWRRSPAALRGAAARAVRSVGGSSIGVEKAAAVLESDGSVAQAYPVLRRLFSPSQQRALLGSDREPDASADPYVRLLESVAAEHADADWMALTSFAEIRTYMHDVLLRDTDQMSMAHGLEVRVPLLDHRLVEYVLGVPESFKAARGTPKRLLVESLPEPLPSECVHRPKRGFVLPFDGWMRGELRAYCESRLGPDGLAGRGILRPDGIDRIWRAFLAGQPGVTWSRPWTLVALEAWMSANGMSA